MRLVLWLLASFSLFELLPLSIDPGRAAKWYAARELPDVDRAPDRAVAIAVIKSGITVDIADLSTPVPAPDGDGVAATTNLPLPFDGPTFPGPFTLLRLDGQAFSAFQSRAPPKDA